MRGYLILPVDVNWFQSALREGEVRIVPQVDPGFDPDPYEVEPLLGPGFEAQALAELERTAPEDAEQQELAEMGVETKGGVPCE